MARGRAISPEEDSIIRLGLQNKATPTHIASVLGRSRQAVHKRIKRMEMDGTIAQIVADLGQFDEC